MGDKVSAIDGNERKESLVEQFKKLQKMALNGDVKFSFNNLLFDFNKPKVSDGSTNPLTGSWNEYLK